jgi:small GTP-binding protein
MANNFQIKCVILGNEFVGKSTLMELFIYEKVKNTISTVGCLFYAKEISIPNEKYNIIYHIWDTAGQERFRSIVPMYYRGTKVFIIVFDIGNKNSFDTIDFWINQIQSSNPNDDDYIIQIIGNKIDLSHQVSSEEIRNKEIKYNTKILLLSAIDINSYSTILTMFQNFGLSLYPKLSKKLLVKSNNSNNSNIVIFNNNISLYRRYC